MELQYVGPKPIIDQHGIDFDKSEPDRYIFIHAVLELIESIEACYDNSCKGIIDITEYTHKHVSGAQLVEFAKKHCSEQIEEIIIEKELRLDTLISEYKQHVHDNDLLQIEDKEAWLGNIDIMEGYYKQFVQNEVVYECLLDILAQNLYQKRIKEIIFDLGNNYGFVFTYLQNVLSEHKPPLDAEMQIEVREGHTVGHFYIRHPQKANI